MKLLLTINIAFGVDGQGQNLTDPLWVKDLVINSSLLDEIVVCAPRTEGGIPAGWVPIPQDLPIRFVALPWTQGLLAAIRAIPKTRAILGDAMKTVDIVQLNVAGWPIPLGPIALGVARSQGKSIVTVVESTPWRGSKGLVGLLKSSLFEYLAKKTVAGSHLSFFTHQGYLDTLSSPALRNSRGAMVVPATWIDGDLIVTDREFEASWKKKPSDCLKVLFAGQLKEAKGTLVVEDLVNSLGAEDRVMVSIIGDGPDRPRMEELAKNCPDKAAILHPVPYVPDFFYLIDQFDLVLVPTLSDEQPRIIFDAYARGVPVLASQTEGNRQIVEEGVTGWMVPPGDVAALKKAMLHLAGKRNDLKLAGQKAIAVAQSMTHAKMHETRFQKVREFFHL